MRRRRNVTALILAACIFFLGGCEDGMPVDVPGTTGNVTVRRTTPDPIACPTPPAGISTTWEATVLDADGNPVVNESVTFSVNPGQPDANFQTTVVNTGPNGAAISNLIVAPTAASTDYTITASAGLLGMGFAQLRIGLNPCP